MSKGDVKHVNPGFINTKNSGILCGTWGSNANIRVAKKAIGLEKGVGKEQNIRRPLAF